MADYRNLELRLSGGAANTDAALALGGAMSTVAGGIIYGQEFTWTPMSALTIVGGSGNAIGAASLVFTLTGTTLKWSDAGSAYGPAVNVNTNGTYILYNGSITAYIIVTKSGTLPVADNTQAVTVTNKLNNLFDDISLVQCSSGMTDYRCMFIKNTHATETMASVRLWLDTDPAGPSVMTMGADPNGVSAAAVTIADELTAPTGVTFSVPTAVAPITLGTLAPSAYVALWLKRDVPTDSGGGLAHSLTKLGVAWS